MSLSINEIILILMQKGTQFIRISLLLQQLMKSLKYLLRNSNQRKLRLYHVCITALFSKILGAIQVLGIQSSRVVLIESYNDMNFETFLGLCLLYIYNIPLPFKVRSVSGLYEMLIHNFLRFIQLELVSNEFRFKLQAFH